MTLYDIVKDKEFDQIVYYCNYPDNIAEGLSELERREGMFMGLAQYKNGELISLDDDDYYLSETIDRYFIDGNRLDVYITVGWSSDEEN